MSRVERLGRSSRDSLNGSGALGREGFCEDGNPLPLCRPWKLKLIASIARASASIVPGEIPGPVFAGRVKHWCSRGLNLFWWLAMRVAFHGLGEHSLKSELAAESVAVALRDYEDSDPFPRAESW